MIHSIISKSMKQLILQLFRGFVLLYAVTAGAQAVHVRTVVLDNGMKVWLNEDHTQPKIYGAVVVNAGGADCPNTGIAHYFEHILFKGTTTLGTTDYESERPYLDSISGLYDQLAETRNAEKREEIQRAINRLNIAAAKYAIPNEFSQLVSYYGGTGLNAYTSYDNTVYFNTFAPQYLTQWAWLNSERLIDPVFRLFQGELETVYEEKNRAADDPFRTAVDHGLAELMKGTPYAYPLLGSTEHLKNPQLSQMKRFYDEQYVAGNMTLLLCGDFRTDSILPLLQRTFGRIRTGNAPAKSKVELPSWKGEKDMEVKIPIPLLRVVGRVYKAPLRGTTDRMAAELMIRLLSNSNGSGMLDSLTNEGNIMYGIAGIEGFNRAQTIFTVVVPKLPFGSKKKAETLLARQIEKIKQGAFDRHVLETEKQNYAEELRREEEKLDTRAATMIDLISEGRTWEDYQKDLKQLQHITPQEVMKVAQKYFSEEYRRIVKRFGSYPKDKLTQPGYKPVKPENMDAVSEFARKLSITDTATRTPQWVDMKHDAMQSEPLQGVRLLSVQNDKNRLFTLRLNYYTGTAEDKRLAALATYLETAGTDSMTRQQLAKRMQRMGLTWSIQGDAADQFSITLEGRDDSLEAAIKLLAEFMTSAKTSDEQLQQIKQQARLGERTFFNTGTTVGSAVIEKVMYGTQSEYLTRLKAKELKSLRHEDFRQMLHTLPQHETAIIYTGTVPHERVSALLRTHLLHTAPSIGYKAPHRKLEASHSGRIYVFEQPKARQNKVYLYARLPKADNVPARVIRTIWNEYTGGSMSSVLFQEVRELRAMAYTAYGRGLASNINRFPNDSTGYVVSIGTQADKTIELLNVLDTLLTDMKINARHFDVAKRNIMNEMSNSYPSFREKGDYIARLLKEGYTSNPQPQYYEALRSMTAEDMARYYTENVQHAPWTVIVVGKISKKQLAELQQRGEVIRLKPEDVF